MTGTERNRLIVFGLISLALAIYYAFSESFFGLSLWGDTAFISLVLFPAVFALVLLALPLRERRGLILLALACGALSVALDVSVGTGRTWHEAGH